MTTVSDGLFQYGGLPVGATGVPTTFGKYIFVNPDATGNADGKTMATAYRTVGAAVTAARTNRHDVILMHAQSAHDTSTGTDTELTLTKNRVHFVGLGGGSRYLGQRTRWTMGVTAASGGAIAVVQNTGVGNTFTNIKFDSSDTESTSLYAFADGGEYTQLTNCEVVKSTLLSNTGRAAILANGDSAYYKSCAFGSLVYQVTAKCNQMLVTREQITGKVARDVIVEDCLFLTNTTSSDASLVHGDNANDAERMLLFKNCGFLNAVLSTADPDQAVEFDATQTQGSVVADNCWSLNCTAFSTTTGVFSATGIKSVTGPEALQSS